jgi:hypothetical protein
MCQRALEEKASLQSATVYARGRGLYVIGRRARVDPRLGSLGRLGGPSSGVDVMLTNRLV